MRIWLQAVLGIALLATAAAPAWAQDTGAGAEGAPVLVVHSEGATERLAAGGAAALLDTGQEIEFEQIVRLGLGASLSLVPTEGAAAGQVITLSGPAEGTVSELLKAAQAGAGHLATDDVEVLRERLPSELAGPGVTRGAAQGPLRPIYPEGNVAAPCGEFLMVVGLDDLDGAQLEARLYDSDPSKGNPEPIARRTTRTKRGRIDLAAGTELTPKKTYWWRVAAVQDGEELLVGDAVRFKLGKAKVNDVLPPEGFTTPGVRGSWHLVRAKKFIKQRFLLDAYREYAVLIAAGGGSKTVLKQHAKLAKKLGLGEEDAAVVEAVASEVRPGSHVLKTRDGRTFAGFVVADSGDAVVFQALGTRYRIERSNVAKLEASSAPPLPSAAPFIKLNSKRYIIETNAGEEFGKQALRELEALFEAFADTLGKGLGARNAKNLKAKIFRDDVDFRAFIGQDHPGQEDSQGFYSFGDTTLYLYRSHQGGKETTFQTLYHEGTHQIMHIVCNMAGATTLRSGFWMGEALPCYMEGLEWKDGSLQVIRPPANRAANFARLSKKRSLVPLDEFVQLNQIQFRSADKYDQGNALAWFLLHSDDGKLRKKFLKYAKSMLQNRSAKGLDEKIFKQPLTEVAAGYEAWFLGREWPQ